jgi:hypothetical protein
LNLQFSCLNLPSAGIRGLCTTHGSQPHFYPFSCHPFIQNTTKVTHSSLSHFNTTVHGYSFVLLTLLKLSLKPSMR